MIKINKFIVQIILNRLLMVTYIQEKLLPGLMYIHLEGIIGPYLFQNWW